MKLIITHKGDSKHKYWRTAMGRSHDRAFWRALAKQMFGELHTKPGLT